MSIDIDNSANYVITRKKVYSVFCCMPPLGTVVENYLEQSKYTIDEVRQFVVSGTVGEQWAIDLRKLQNTYRVQADVSDKNSEDISLVSLIKKYHVIGRDLVINIIPWFMTTTREIPDTYFAMFIPNTISFDIQTSWGDKLTVNTPGMDNGAGDVIVCASKDGEPDLTDRWVVDGRVFPATYDVTNFGTMFGSKRLAAIPKKPKELFDANKFVLMGD